MRKTAAVLLATSTLFVAGAFAQTSMKYEGQSRSSKLIGVNVYNNANEKLGDINELILDKNGKVENVVIGVGGFLGIGEHDIAVSYDKLKFVDKPVERSTSDARPATTTTNTTGSSTTTTTSSTATTTSSSSRNWYPDHAVLDATKDQLKTMPEFKYSSYN